MRHLNSKKLKSAKSGYIWGTDNKEKSNLVRVYLNHLRHKIEDNPAQPKRIVNEPGIGYRFNLLGTSS